jgi:hypothetical protein
MDVSIVEAALRRPIQWAHFEKIVVDVLRNDDMPGIHKLGGVKDAGLDAEDEKYYESEEVVRTVVQITSQVTQIKKLKDTFTKLQKNGVDYQQLIIIFQDPVEPSVETEMKAIAKAHKKLLLVRGESYLVGQLSRVATGVFAQNFGKAREQESILFDQKAVLDDSTDRLERGVLATACAFAVFGEDKVRMPLIRYMVLGLAATSPEGKSTPDGLFQAVEGYIPGLPRAEFNAALDALHRQKHLNMKSAEVTVAAVTRTNLAARLSEAEGKLTKGLDALLKAARSIAEFDNAALGRAHRNVRSLLTRLVRSLGPATAESAQEKFQDEFDAMRERVSDQLGDGLNRFQCTALTAALDDFLREPTNAPVLGGLIRAYSIVAACRLDPLQKTFSQKFYEDKNIFLDTDTVQSLLIREHPECDAVRLGLRALTRCKAKLIVTDEILEEVADHFGRSIKTFDRLPGLRNYSAATARERIRNTLTLGYYFADGFGPSREDFFDYRLNYFDPRNPVGYIKQLLSETKLPIICPGSASDQLVGEEKKLRDEIAAKLALGKENLRSKAEYRSEEWKKERALVDASLAVLAARKTSRPDGSETAGVVLSHDMGYISLQGFEEWKGKPLVRLSRLRLPALAEMLQMPVPDSALVKLLWSATPTLYAEAYTSDLELLSRQGVNLRRKSSLRLMSDFSSVLENIVASYRGAVKQETPTLRRIKAMHELHRACQDAGYSVGDSIAEIAKIVATAEATTKDGDEAKEKAKALVRELVTRSGATHRYRRRVQSAITDLGLEDFLEDKE